MAYDLANVRLRGALSQDDRFSDLAPKKHLPAKPSRWSFRAKALYFDPYTQEELYPPTDEEAIWEGRSLPPNRRYYTNI